MNFDTVTQHFYDGRTASDGTPADFAKACDFWQRGVAAGCMRSAVELGCLLWRDTPGIPARPSRVTELFDQVQSSRDYNAQLYLFQRLQHGTCGVDVDRDRAASLLERAAALGWTAVPLVLHGRMVLHAAAAPTAATMKRAKALFNTAAAEDGWLGCAELGLLYQYSSPGIPRDALAAKTQLQRWYRLRSATADYRNDKGDNWPVQRVFELYYGNLLAFGGEGVGRDIGTATVVLRAAARLFPQASALLAFLHERDGTRGVHEPATAYSSALYADAAPSLWSVFFNFKDRLDRAAKLGSKFYWNMNVNLFENYNFVGTRIADKVCADKAWAPHVTKELVHSVDIISAFCMALVLERGESPFPKDLGAARTLFQHCTDRGHIGAKQKLETLPNNPPPPSPLILAFVFAVEQPAVLTEDFVRKFVRAEHVSSAYALICGHNLVMLALRAGVLDSNTIGETSDITNSWYFREQLYHPASKLVDEDPTLLTAVFRHAEKIGIVPDGYLFTVGLSIRHDAKATAQSIVNVLGDISQQLSSLSQRLSTVEVNVNALDKDIGNLFEGFQHLSQRQVDAEKSISTLADSLTDLHSLLKKKERNSIYAGLAKCIISLVPVVGVPLSNMVDVGVELIAGLATDDVVSVATDASKALVDHIAHVDVSNFRVARVVFSEKGIGKLEASAKAKVLNTIAKSEFQSLASLQDALNGQVHRTQRENKLVKLIDMGKNPWSTAASSASSSSTTGLPSEADSFKGAAENYFKYLISANVVDHEEGGIDPPVALTEINQLLTKDRMETISNDSFLDVFFEECDGADMVNEELFVKIYIHFRIQFQQASTLDAIKTDCQSYADRKFFAGDDMKPRQATLFLRAFYKRQVQQGLLASIEASTGPENPFEMAIEAAKAGSELVSKAEFVSAMVELAKEHLC